MPKREPSQAHHSRFGGKQPAGYALVLLPALLAASGMNADRLLGDCACPDSPPSSCLTDALDGRAMGLSAYYTSQDAIEANEIGSF